MRYLAFAASLCALLFAAAVPAAEASSPHPSRPAAVGRVPSSGSVGFNGTVAASLGLRARSHASKFTDVTLNDPVIGVYPQNTEVHVFCVLNGPSETGPWGTTAIWDAIDYYQEPGQNVTFYSPIPPYAVSSDAWINTGTNSPVAPLCSSA